MTLITRRALWALSLCGAFAVAGCGGGSNGPTSPNATSTPAPTLTPAPTFVPSGGEATINVGKIVYLNQRSQGSSSVPPRESTIMLVEPNRAPRAIVRPDAPGAINSSPSLSPDGNRIAFVSSSDAIVSPGVTGTDLYTINIDGSGLKRVTRSGQVARFGTPQWTPGGDRIYFVYDGPPSAFGKGIGVVSAQGGVPQTFIGTAEDPVGDIAISPDGRNLAYLTSNFKSSDQVSKLSQVYVKSLTNNAPVRRLTSSLADKLSVTFSPDGQRLAFSANNIPALSIINLDGTGERVLAANTDVTLDLTWSPDGQTLAYSNGSRIKLISANGTSAPRDLALPATTRTQFAPSWGR